MRKSEKKQRSAIISVRLTPTEFEHVSHAAKLRSFSMSDFMRSAVLDRANEPYIEVVKPALSGPLPRTFHPGDRIEFDGEDWVWRAADE